MDQPLLTPWYVSRRVDLPLADAAAALDELVGQRRPAGRDPAQLTRALLAHGSAPGFGSARTLHGRLRLPRGGVAVRVELELAAWSATRSELGLRPRRPPAARATRYWATAAGTLEDLRGDLVAVAATPPTAALRRAS